MDAQPTVKRRGVKKSESRMKTGGLEMIQTVEKYNGSGGDASGRIDDQQARSGGGRDQERVLQKIGGGSQESGRSDLSRVRFRAASSRSFHSAGWN